MEMPGKLLCLLAFVRLWGPGPQSFGVSLTLPQHKEDYAFMCLCVCVCVHVWTVFPGPALLNNEHSFKLGEAD